MHDFEEERMKILRRVFLILGLSAVIACSWMAPMDPRATAQVDASLKRALISFASARAIGGLLSVVQATQVDFQKYGKPEIFNTDQGSQFTSEAFTGALKARGVAISMDGKGAWRDECLRREAMAHDQVRGGLSARL
jgi:transposase InsO family protein